MTIKQNKAGEKEDENYIQTSIKLFFFCIMYMQIMLIHNKNNTKTANCKSKIKIKNRKTLFLFRSHQIFLRYLFQSDHSLYSQFTFKLLNKYHSLHFYRENYDNIRTRIINHDVIHLFTITIVVTTKFNYRCVVFVFVHHFFLKKAYLK